MSTAAEEQALAEAVFYPGPRNDGTKVRHITEMLMASLVHQYVSDRHERQALCDAFDRMPDAYCPGAAFAAEAKRLGVAVNWPDDAVYGPRIGEVIDR